MKSFHSSCDVINSSRRATKWTAFVVLSSVSWCLQDSEDLSTTTESFITKSRPLPGNHGDNHEETEEGDVSGLINSDGEEEDWRPALVGTPSLWIQTGLKFHVSNETEERIMKNNDPCRSVSFYWSDDVLTHTERKHVLLQQKMCLLWCLSILLEV